MHLFVKYLIASAFLVISLLAATFPDPILISPVGIAGVLLISGLVAGWLYVCADVWDSGNWFLAVLFGVGPFTLLAIGLKRLFEYISAKKAPQVC